MKIKILFISQYLNVAGTETFMMNILKNIDRSRFHVDFLIFSNDESKYCDEAESLGSTIYRLPNRKTGVDYYKSLDLFFQKYAIDYQAIHFCGGSVSSIAPIFNAYKYRIPIRIVHSHNSFCDGFHNIILHKINRIFLEKLCTHFFACSSKAAKFFYGSKEAIIIKNGIDLKSYIFNESNRNLLRNELKISSDTKVIGHIGRFEAVKNHSFIIDIFKKYNENNPNSVLILVGIGSLLDNVKNKVEKINLSSKVFFLGERTDIPNILSSMDCFLMPSIFEGLPFVLIEAQASGLPCVVSNTVNHDVKISPVLHFESLKNDIKSWVETINTAMLSKDRIKIADYVEKQGFDIIPTVKFLENVYANIL